MKYRLPILLYHDLESPDFSNEKTGTATMDTVVSLENFDTQLQYLSENGYKTLSLKEYITLRAGSAQIPSKSIIITFDDGHHSNYHLAFPALLKYGFRGTFFVIAERVGREYHLDRKQIEEMVAHGMEIGSHGLTHKFLPLMDNDSIERELARSKKILENIIAGPVGYFAFPGGHYNKNVLDALMETGYAGACSCLQGLNGRVGNPYLLKRIEIRRRFSPTEFSHVFNPAHILFYQVIDMWKNALRQAVGLERYARLRSRFYKFYIFRR